MGNYGDSKFFGHLSIPVTDMNPGCLIFLYGFFPMIGILVDTHSENLEALRSIFPVEFQHVLAFSAARASPGRPKIHQNPFSFQFVQRTQITRLISQPNISEFLADGLLAHQLPTG